MSTGSQVNVSHSAPKWRGSYSQEGGIVDAHKVRGRGVRGANRGVSFNRRRRKHFLYERKEGRVCGTVLPSVNRRNSRQLPLQARMWRTVPF